MDTHALVEVHTSTKLGNSLSKDFGLRKTGEGDSIKRDPILGKRRVDEMLRALDQMHKLVNKFLSASRSQAVEDYNVKTHMRSFNPPWRTLSW